MEQRNQKHTIFAGFVFTALAIVLFATCSSPVLSTDSASGTTGSLTISLEPAGDGSTRSILPLTISPSAIATYDVTLTRSGYNTISMTGLTGLSLPVTGLATGIWSLTVAGYDSGHIKITEGTVSTVTINAGNNSVIVNLLPIRTAGGSGTLTVTFKYSGIPADILNDEVILATWPAGVTRDISAGVSGTPDNISINCSVPSGTYLLTVNLFHDGLKSIKYPPITSIVQIYDNRTSSAALTYTQTDLTQPPDAPVGLTVVGTSPGKLQFNWTSASNTAAGFHVYKDSALVANLSAQTCTWNDVDASIDASYSVKSWNYIGESATSANYIFLMMSISMTPQNPILAPGQTLHFNATISPSNAVPNNLFWTSSNAAVATVDSTGLVTALTVGTTVIEVKGVTGQMHTIVTVALPPAHRMEEFYFPGLSSGIINETISNIIAYVPIGTNVSNLTPTFYAPGATVTCNGITQTSGVTPQNFTGSQDYTVTFADSTVKNYTVGVEFINTVPNGLSTFFIGLKGVSASGVFDGTSLILRVDGDGPPAVTNVGSLPSFQDSNNLIMFQTLPGYTLETTSGDPIDFEHKAGDYGLDFSNTVVTLRVVGPAPATSYRDYTIKHQLILGTDGSLSDFGIVFPGQGVVTGTIDNVTHTINVTVPNNANLASDRGIWETTDKGVVGASQPGPISYFSGSQSSNSYGPLNLALGDTSLTMTAQDGTPVDYTIHVSSESPKEFSNFSVGGYPGTIMGTNILVPNVPAGTDVSAMIATYGTTGNLVTVNNTTQTSGVTPNDFTNPVVYTVRGIDSMTKSYTVMVSKHSQTFSSTGAAQPFTVPSGITSVFVDVQGAAGDSPDLSYPGGPGGRVLGVLGVQPAEVLNLYVGSLTFNGAGEPGAICDGYSTAGAGGGASDIRQGGTDLLNRVVVAGGGGGSNGTNEFEGLGGIGGCPFGGTATPGNAGSNGYGGTQTGPGIQTAAAYGGQPGTWGQLGSGGRGGDAWTTSSRSDYYPTTSFQADGAGAGGGGGFFGGSGGGGGPTGGGGGGGSSLVPDAFTSMPGYNPSTDGSITLYW